MLISNLQVCCISNTSTPVSEKFSLWGSAASLCTPDIRYIKILMDLKSPPPPLVLCVRHPRPPRGRARGPRPRPRVPAPCAALPRASACYRWHQPGAHGGLPSHQPGAGALQPGAQRQAADHRVQQGVCWKDMLPGEWGKVLSDVGQGDARLTLTFWAPRSAPCFPP